MRFLDFSRQAFVRRRSWFIGVAFAILLIIGALCVARPLLLEPYLEGPQLRTLVSRKTARELKAPAGFLPLEWRGLSVYSDAALARRNEDKGLQEMRARSLSARCNLMEMWRGKWRIEKLTIDHLQAAFGTHARKRLVDDFPAQPTLDPPADKESPLAFSIEETLIRRTDLWWGKEATSSGGFSEVETQYFVDGKNLSIQGHNGTFQQTGWPEAKVGSFRLYYAKPHLRVDEGALSIGEKGIISVLGSFDFSENGSMDLQLDFKQCPLAPFLKPEWREKLAGVFRASAKLRKQFGNTGRLSAAGELQISGGRLKSLAVLDQLAAFTGRPELRRLSIDRLEGAYDWDTPKLKVTTFRFESKGVVSVRGEFTIEKDGIQGEFRVGAAPDLVEKFPGAREEVFTRAEDNYLWTTVNVTGPLKKPREDLKPRLVAAAEKHFAKGILAPILKPGTNIIEAIDRLFE